MQRRKPNIIGLTILEMMIVVIIIGILASLSFVGFRKMTAHQKLIGETNNSVAAVKYIVSEARTSKRNIHVRLDYTEELIVAWIDADGDDIPDSSETIILNNEMPTGVDLYGGKIGTSVSTTHQTFELFDDGSTTENVVFVLRSDTTGESKAIRIKAINGWVDLIDDIPTI
ncbi:hypothetical protein DRQ36_09315 [bacterium]|nr:MAG: hypothetical protein DRQ36_09315 [bacterium]